MKWKKKFKLNLKNNIKELNNSRKVKVFTFLLFPQEFIKLIPLL